MSAHSLLPHVVRFGIFEADFRNGELRRSGIKIRLQEQPFRLLAVLLERPGEVVTREEIRQRLWPSDTFVSFDHSLNTAANKLRDALGDAASNPRFIETIPRRGYRFIAPVQVEPPAELPEPAATPRSARLLAAPEEVPDVSPRLSRTLFTLLQIMYLAMYLSALAGLEEVEAFLGALFSHPLPVFLTLLVTALLGIAARLYLLSAAVFRYSGLKNHFLRLFPFLFVLDELWSLSPLLLEPTVGLGLALAATAALAFAPFAQRTLLLMESRASAGG